MKKSINQFISNLKRSPGCSPDSIHTFETKFQISFPVDYKDFLSSSNGAEGFVGQAYLALWSVELMEEINQMDMNEEEKEEYEIGLILFGSNGGGEYYAFDTKQSPVSIVNFPCVGIDPDTIEIIGNTFYDFLQYLYNLRYR